MRQFENGSLPDEARVAALPRRLDDVGSTAGGLLSLLPASMTWSATVDTGDGISETEITEEMVKRAIAAVEREQPWPFRTETGSDAGLVARAVRKADVIAFPRARPNV